MNIYVVKYQPSPGHVFREHMVTENIAMAKEAKHLFRRRRAYIATWRNGRLVAAEEPAAP